MYWSFIKQVYELFIVFHSFIHETFTNHYNTSEQQKEIEFAFCKSYYNRQNNQSYAHT